MLRRIRVAAAQMEAHGIDDAEQVWGRVTRIVNAAAARGARLVVLPECTYPAYWLQSVARYRSGGLLSSEAALARFGEIAAGHRIALCVGFVESSGERLFNAAALIHASGKTLGVHRKSVLWDCDNEWFAPGDAIEPIESPIGRIGILICADARAPETIATLVRRGAELIVVPTAWVNASTRPGEFRNIQAEFLIRARATEFGVPFVCADKSGCEGPLRYVGTSQVVTAHGEVVAIAGPMGEELLVADIDTSPGRVRDVSPAMLADLRSDPAVVEPWSAGRLVRMAVWPMASAADGRSALAAQATLAAELALVGDELLTRALPREASAPDAPDYRVVRLPGDEVHSFHPARSAALRGARVVAFCGVAEDDELQLRTRAAENRVFVLAASPNRAWAVAPTGEVLAREGLHQEPARAEVDLGAADEKHVAPRTDIWEQRRPRLYDFGGKGES